MLLFDTLKKPLLEWYSILETLGFKVGEDYYWTHDHKTHMWGVRFNYPKQETITLLKANGFTFKEVTMSDKKRWTLEVQEDPETGDAILEFPQDLLNVTGWGEGDVLKWSDLGGGTWSLTKKVMNTNTNTFCLTKTQIEKLATLARQFKEVEWYTLTETHSSGIGPSVNVQFKMFSDDVKDHDTMVDITDVSTW